MLSPSEPSAQVAASVPPEELAILAVAQRTGMLTSFVLMVVNLVVAPKFAALYKQGKSEQLERIALQATKLMVLFTLPIIGFMLIFPEWLMWLFGEQYKSGANLLRILALGQFGKPGSGLSLCIIVVVYMIRPTP